MNVSVSVSMAIPHTFKAAKEKKRISKNPAGLFQEKCTRPSLWTELRPQELLAGPQPQGECVQRSPSSSQRPPKVSRAGVASRPAVGAGRRPHVCSRGLRAGRPLRGTARREASADPNPVRTSTSDPRPPEPRTLACCSGHQPAVLRGGACAA